MHIVKYVNEAISILDSKDEKAFLENEILLDYEKNYKNWNNIQKRKIILSRLVSKIKNSKSLDEITQAFLMLKRWGKYDLDLFDFKKFHELTKNFKEE